ncbi:MAG: DUF1972 domain-containing protein [Candidatus Aminicenantes bacterium]|jgi:glycosyltransferase involved in cell wall biosynthesis
MKIAIIGTRGVPARYGGFETCAEELGKRLVCRGHEVFVYGHSNYYQEKPSEYVGMKPIYLRGLRLKAFETLSHTLSALLHAVRRPYDIYFVFNCANSPLLVLPKALRKNVVLHVDGLEWKRAKWSALGRKYYRFAERLAAKLRVELVSDNGGIRDHYREKHNRETHCIPYGARLEFSQNSDLLAQFGLNPGEYFLQITRIEPENNPDLSVKAFSSLETDKKLVLVGDVKYKSSYASEVFSTQDKRIHFLGYLYDKNILRELRCNAFAYFHGNEVGGTNPALLEAMAAGRFVLARDVPFNREVLRDAGVYFQKDLEDVKAKMSWTLDNADKLKRLGEKARAIIRENYNWDAVVDAYETLFHNIMET